MRRSHPFNVLVTSDLHQHIPKWKQLREVVCTSKPDCVLICGDLLPKGSLAEQRGFLQGLSREFIAMYQAAQVRPLLFLGNDDFHVLEPLLDRLEAEGLCVNMNGRVHRQDGLVFCGMNRIRDYPYAYKHWCAPDGSFVVCDTQFAGEGMTLDDRGEEVPLENLRDYLLQKPSLGDELNRLAGQLKRGEMQSSIWMIHQPPSRMGMDLITDGIQIGSPNVYQFILKKQPLLGCSGHAHESPYQAGGKWSGRIKNTLWLQPGQMGEKLHYVTFELDEQLRILNLHHSIFGKAEA